MSGDGVQRVVLSKRLLTRRLCQFMCITEAFLCYFSISVFSYFKIYKYNERLLIVLVSSLLINFPNPVL